jgi:biopolymer transport protein ExbD
MKVQGDSQPYDTINVTPMLDLAYVLLVVFILLTTASVQGLNISMPKPSNKPSTEVHEVKVVTVTAQGPLLVNGMSVSMEELQQQLASAKARDPKTSVMIKGDMRTQYQRVVAVIDLCNTLGVNMGLVTGKIGI